MKLFISYSRDDKLYVYELADRLRDDGAHTIWIDKSALVGGDSWWEAICKGVENAECVIAVLSPRALGSIFCDAELRYAQALGKPILPLMLKTVDIPKHLSHVQAENISEISLERAYGRCERALGQIELRRERGQIKEIAARPENRPAVPVLEAGQPSEHVFEVYVMAVEALEVDAERGKKLLQQVIKADPSGLGVQAAERLAEFDYEQERTTAYLAIARLAGKPSMRRDAVRTWKAYTIRYGGDYDPNGYAQTLVDAPTHHAGDRWTDPKGVPMVYVPEGEFLMGSTPQQVNEAFEQGKKEYKDALKEWYEREMPQHRQTIAKPFWLDLTPVTNAEYARFIKDGGYQNAAFWTKGGWEWVQKGTKTEPVKYDGFTDLQQPRVGVTWFEANAYCQWRGGRLPTEAEWEWAARGPENKLYPWGNTFKAENVIYRANSGNKTAVVGENIRKAGESWVKALDMSGNVWEWCNSAYLVYPYVNDEQHESIINDNINRVLRGGSWVDNSSILRAAYRIRIAPDSGNNNVGFRSVRSV